MRLIARLISALAISALLLPGPAGATPVPRDTAGDVGLPAWDVVPTPNDGVGRNRLAGVSALTPSDVWAVGNSGARLFSDARPLWEHYDGAAWTIVPSPKTAASDLSAVEAVAADDVWAVGGYNNTGKSLIEHWDGSRIRLVPHPNKGSLNQLHAIDAASASDLWAVGEWADGGVSHTLTQHFDGSRWRIVPSPGGAPGYNELYGVAVIGPDDVWAVGQDGAYRSLTLHWDGTEWTHVPSPTEGSESTFAAVSAISGDDVWAVGWSLQGPISAHWNGTRWRLVPDPGDLEGSLNGVEAIAPDDVWAVGRAERFGDDRTLALHWDGTTWNIAPSPSPGYPNELNAVSATASSDVWAVGESEATLVEHWDGSAWQVVPSDNVGTGTNHLNSIDAIAPDDVWTVGETEGRTLTEHWDGRAFSIVPSPNRDLGRLDNTLEDVNGLESNDVWAVGHADVRGFIGSRSLAMHWDGSAWRIVPTPNFGGQFDANDLTGVAAVSADDVWAVGTFQNNDVGGRFRALTLHWDGRRWNAVRNDCGSSLSDVTAFGPNDVWAVGGPGGCHWNGTSWTLFPSAPSPGGGAVDLLDVAGASSNDLWAVGGYAYTCGKGLCFVGSVEHWDGTMWRYITSAGQVVNGVSAVGPNDVYAVGVGIGQFILHYDGSGWEFVPSPDVMDYSDLQSVDAPGPADLWAAGIRSSGNGDKTLVEHAPSPTSGAVVGDTNVSGATVSWFGPESGSTGTDLFGSYQAGGLTAGRYIFTATAGGCDPDTAAVTIRAGTTIQQDFRLSC